MLTTAIRRALRSRLDELIPTLVDEEPAPIIELLFSFFDLAPSNLDQLAVDKFVHSQIRDKLHRYFDDNTDTFAQEMFGLLRELRAQFPEEEPASNGANGGHDFANDSDVNGDAFDMYGDPSVSVPSPPSASQPVSGAKRRHNTDDEWLGNDAGTDTEISYSHNAATDAEEEINDDGDSRRSRRDDDANTHNSADTSYRSAYTPSHSHVSNDSQQPMKRARYEDRGQRPPKICFAFERTGQCRHGANCKFEHVAGGQSNNSYAQSRYQQQPDSQSQYHSSRYQSASQPGQPNGANAPAQSQSRFSTFYNQHQQPAHAPPLQSQDYSRGGGRPSQFSSHSPASSPQTKLLITDIPAELRKLAPLTSHFSMFGEISGLQLMGDGRAEVSFESPAAAQAAYNHPKAVFDNRFIRVLWANETDAPRANGSHYIEPQLHVPPPAIPPRSAHEVAKAIAQSKAVTANTSAEEFSLPSPTPQPQPQPRSALEVAQMLKVQQAQAAAQTAPAATPSPPPTPPPVQPVPTPAPAPSPAPQSAVDVAKSLRVSQLKLKMNAYSEMKEKFERLRGSMDEETRSAMEARMTKMKADISAGLESPAVGVAASSPNGGGGGGGAGVSDRGRGFARGRGDYRGGRGRGRGYDYSGDY